MTLLNPVSRLDRDWAQLPMDPMLGGRRLELKDGDAVYESDTPAELLFFVEAGQVRTYEISPDGSSRMIEIFGPGDWFGEESLAAAEAYCCQAITASDATLWAVPVDRLMDLLAEQPAISADLIRRLAMRLQQARHDASQFVFDDCSARLIKALLRFSDTAAATQQEDGAVQLRITHRQLAQAVGAARETVSLAMTQFRRQNLLRTGRNRLTFRPEKLRAHLSNGHGSRAQV